ncbi:MAG: alpha-xylosidase, partial [Pseudomonadota bacterium]
MNTGGAFDPLREKWSAYALPKIEGAARAAADGAVVAPTSLGDMTVALLNNGVRLRLGPSRAIDYGLLVGATAARPADVLESDGVTTISNGTFRFELENETLAFKLFKNGAPVIKSATDGHFVRSYRLPPFARVDNGWIAHFDLGSNDRIYGLGEKWGPLNKRGQLIQSYNHDALGVNTEASYKNAPFAWSPRGWGVFCHTPSPVTHGVGFPSWSQRAYGVFIEDASLDLFVFAGEDGADLIG